LTRYTSPEMSLLVFAGMLAVAVVAVAPALLRRDAPAERVDRTAPLASGRRHDPALPTPREPSTGRDDQALRARTFRTAAVGAAGNAFPGLPKGIDLPVAEAVLVVAVPLADLAAIPVWRHCGNRRNEKGGGHAKVS
jgi:hypothetical protein